MKQQNSQPPRLGTPSRLALFSGLLLAGVAATPVAAALGATVVGTSGAVTGGIAMALPHLLEVGKGWLVNKLSSEDGPSDNHAAPPKVATVFRDTQSIAQAIGEAIGVLSEHVRLNPKFTPDEATSEALGKFSTRAVENVKWFFQENPPEDLNNLGLASFPELLGARGLPEILDPASATRLISELEGRTSGQLPEPARSELIRLCATRLHEALVGVFAHHLAEGDHSFAGFQLKASAETLSIVRDLQRAVQDEFPQLHVAIQNSTKEIKETVRVEAEETRKFIASEMARLIQANEYLEASSILQKVISEADDLVKHHKSGDAEKLLTIFSPHVTDKIEIETRARFYGTLGQAKLESDDLYGALTTLEKSLDISLSSQAASQYHTANLRLTGGSQEARDSLKELISKEPDDSVLASLYVSTLSTKKLQEFEKEVLRSVGESQIFVLNRALTYSRNGDHDLGLSALDSLPKSSRTEEVDTWRSNFELAKFLSMLQEKNAARLLPNEDKQLSILIDLTIRYLQTLPTNYNDLLFEQQVIGLFAARIFAKNREKIDDVILTVATNTQNQVARLFASRIAFEKGDFRQAADLISFKPSTFLRSQSFWFLTSLEAFSANADLPKLAALRDKVKSILVDSPTPVDEELAISLYQVLAASTIALDEEPNEVANPEYFDKLSPSSESPIRALAYLSDIECQVPTRDEALNELETNIANRKWTLVSIWINVLKKLECGDDILSISRLVNKSVASAHLLDLLQIAFQMHDENFSLTTLNSLYEAGYRDIDLSLNFAHALYWHEPTRAMSIVRELVSLYPMSLDVHLLLCQIAGLEYLHEHVCLPKPIPVNWVNSNTEKRYGIVIGLLMQDRVEEAEKIAINLYLSHPSDMFAQKAIVNLFLPFLQCEHHRPAVPTDIERIGPGCYVLCYSPMSRSNQSFWFETGHSEDPVQPSLTITDSLYPKLINMKVGERVVLDTFTTLEIREIRDWRHELFLRAMDQLSSSVVQPKSMWQFSVASDDPAKEYDFTSFFQVINARRDHVQQVLSMARSQPVPAHALARLLDSDLAAAWTEATQAGDMPRVILEDHDSERSVANVVIISDKPILLDETALLNIFLFGLENQLNKIATRLQVCSFARRSVLDWERNTSLFIAYNFFRKKTLPFPINVLAAYRSRLQHFREFFNGLEEVETILFPGKDAVLKINMINAFGRSACQAMSAAAASGAAIVCDDETAKKLMQSEVSAQYFSTLALISALGAQQEVLTDFCAQAIMVGYGGIPFNVTTVVRIYERLGWLASEHAGDALLLASMKSWHRRDSRAYAQIALILESVFLRCEYSELRRGLVFRILNGVFDRVQDDGKVRLVIKALQLKARTGIHLISTEEAAKVVDEWHRHGFRGS